MTGSTDWGLVRGPNGGIVGVYSTSTAQPLKTANFPKEYAAFAGAPSYRDWVFAAGGAAATSGPGGAVAGSGPGAAVPGSGPRGASPAAGPSFNPAAPGATPAPPQGPAVRVP